MRETREIFSEFFLHTLLQKERSKFEKRSFSVQKCHKKRDSILLMHGKSQWEEHLRIFFGIFPSYPLETTLERKKNAIQAFKNVPKFVDLALQEGQVWRKMTRPVNISEKYIWDFFQNSPFISRSRNDIQNIMKNVISILHWDCKNSKIFRFFFHHFVYTHMGWCRDK